MSRINFLSSLFGAVFGVVVMAAFPAMAAQIGDALQLGTTNSINERTTLVGNDPSQSLRIFNNDPSGEALRLSVEPGNAPMIVDSGKRVKSLNADRLDNFHASHLVRAAHGFTDNAPNVNGEVVTATITAPRPGLLLINGGVDTGLSNDGAPVDYYNCKLTVNGIAVPGSERWAHLHMPDSQTEVVNGSEDCTTEGAKAVGAGTHTVAFRVDSLDTAASSVLVEASVWVIWVPFDGNGNSPTP